MRRLRVTAHSLQIGDQITDPTLQVKAGEDYFVMRVGPLGLLEDVDSVNRIPGYLLLEVGRIQKKSTDAFLSRDTIACLAVREARLITLVLPNG